jgi:histone H3/H4
VLRDLEGRRAAFTPGKNRRRSVRERETPRDILRALSRREAPKTAVIASSSSPGDKQAQDGTSRLEEEEDDSLPIDRPRLSLPIDAEDDDGSDPEPHKSAGLEDLDHSAHSLEFARRAYSEQPARLSRSSPGIRMSDYIGDLEHGEYVARDSTTFFQNDAFDDAFDEGPADVDGGDLTYERLDSDAGRRDTMASRRSDFGVIDVPLDANETTVFLAPPRNSSSPSRPAVEGDTAVLDESIGDHGVQHYPDTERAQEASDADVTVDAKATMTIAQRRNQQRKRGKMVSQFGLEYPSLPTGVVKRLAQNFAAKSGVGKTKISPDTLAQIVRASDWFFEQVAGDLAAYSQHAGRRTIEESDMLVLMKRYGKSMFWVSPLYGPIC